MRSVTEHRTSGVLLHPTSFPGGPIGTLGVEAARWVDWLRDAGQGLWQLLPLVAVDAGGSPYNGISAMAGNTLLLDGPALVTAGWLAEAPTCGPHSAEVDFQAAAARADALVRAAQQGLVERPGHAARFAAYRRRHSAWLDDYALFCALREANGERGWLYWPEELRQRRPEALREAREALSVEVERFALGQLLFDEQWAAVRTRAGAAGIRIIGDVPIFVAHDSADVWARPELFQLDDAGCPTVVSGVPPDYFSATGQLWGNPLYDWEAMRRDGFRWWTERFRRTLEMVDLARIDHFRGFESYWEVPAGEPTALHGRWMPGPGEEVFRAVSRSLGPLPLIAEDLGIITADVDALRQALGLPGMRVLQFAFGDDDANPHLPANHPRHAVAYTGTHDNDTARGWWEGSATPRDREGVRRLTGARDEDVHWAMIETVFGSPAALAIVPLQDVLGLGSEGRMNLPGVAERNWIWRCRPGDLTPERAARLRTLSHVTGRRPWSEQIHP